MSTVTRARLRAVGVAVALAVVGFAIGFVVLLALAVLVAAAGVRLDGPGQLVLSLVALQGIGFPLAALLYLRVRDLPLSYVDVSVPSLREVGVGVLAWPALLLLSILTLNGLLALTETEPASNQAAETAMANPEFIPYLIPLVFLLNAPGEELLFRGVIQKSLREHFGPAAAIVLATATFAPLHIFALIGSLQAVAVTIAGLFVPGLVFGAVYEYTENVVTPTLTHGLFNATLFASIYLVSSSGSESLLAL